MGEVQEGRSKYYTPNEVALHNNSADCWISFLGKVYDLTNLINQHKGGNLTSPILAMAGNDISHWFNQNTGDLKTYVDAEKGIVRYYTPHGDLLHIPPSEPRSDYNNDFGRPWWKDRRYEVGTLTKKPRKLRIVNTLTSQQHIIEVCSEETMLEILARYICYNSHAESYTWKYKGDELDKTKTLEENGILDEDFELEELGMDPEQWIPAIHIYFNDDLRSHYEKNSA
ncbi:unnamed protein product [Oikopleura dioica]|uniref:Cytochrome b5 domain-containing protein 1 n=1 Tax=Oikopleura dioica TaxID=34765 RepID=E4XCW1_OIKDI|nr:unnamed protein product [Oikopleura dioica]